MRKRMNILTDAELSRISGGAGSDHHKLTVHQTLEALRICPHCHSFVSCAEAARPTRKCTCPNCGIYYVNVEKLEIRTPDGNWENPFSNL